MNRRLAFCLTASQSPTHYNLQRYLKAQGWSSKRFNWQAHFSDNNLQFNSEAAQQLEYKHLLAPLAARVCPDLMPQTYCINDENWLPILNQLAGEQDSQAVWILKPSLLNNGRHIKILQKVRDLENHFLSSNRLGGEHVLQRYITNPHLLRDRRKYSIRVFMVTTNYAGSFLYPYGYYNVSLHPYEGREFKDLRSHLTNEHLQEDEANVLQIPAQRFADYAQWYPQIKAKLTALMQGLQKELPAAFSCKKKRVLAIFGVDFLLDARGHLWLLEANHGPCFPLSDEHPLQFHLYYEFWQAFIQSFVIPIGENQALDEIHYQRFELLRNKAG